MLCFLLTALLLPLYLTTATPTPFPLDTISLQPLPAIPPTFNRCPKDGNLAPGYLKPTLMVGVSAKFPDVAFGSTKLPLITPNDFCTIFNLVIPPTAVGKTCTLKFLFPDHGASSGVFAYNGAGHFAFTGYAFNTGATEKTT